MTTDHSSEVEFWVDPACPWCWVTARWVTDQIVPQRGIDLVFRPISLLFKNNPPTDSPYYAGVVGTHKMLRVMESIRAAEGDAAVTPWYLYCGTKVHHDREGDFDLAEALVHLGLDPAHAAAAQDESWDVAVRAGMDAGLALVGNDVGTPIIAFTGDDGVKRGIFGPVITQVPPPEQSLAVWDAMRALTVMDGFWELKRTRTTGPEFPPRLDV